MMPIAMTGSGRTASSEGARPEPLGADFFCRPAEAVARDLVGSTLAYRVDGVARRARIVETEAYVGEHDLASHARFGRTRRNAAMWGPAGRAYVYFVYGMHHCLNVVTSTDGDPQAVLLRAAEPLDGWEARLSGPALLAEGFGVTRADDGADLIAGPRWFEPGSSPAAVVAAPRVGVDYAGAWARAPLRFLDAASPAVSRPPPKRRTFKATPGGARGG